MAANWQVAWVTGASSGIGREVALQLAARGAKVAISARSTDKLAEIARGNSACHVYPLDVTDQAATSATVAAIERDLGAIDLAVLNAGTWEPAKVKDLKPEAVAHAMAVNYQGVVNGIAALLPSMIARQSGHLGLVASVAGYRGLPRAGGYGPTKAALINLAETLAGELPAQGVSVSLINPGFVATPMTAGNTFPMPFMVQADDAARRIVRGLERGRFEIAFPWQLVALLKLARVLPYPLYFWIVRNVLAKERQPD